MAVIGYIRVSTVDQSLEVQQNQLSNFGVEKIFSDQSTGTNRNRVGLIECMNYLRAGDKLVITKMDRLGRNALDLHQLANELESNGVGLVILDQSIDTSTPAGKMFFTMLAGFSEFETNLRRERQMLGIQAAKNKGVYQGRKGLSVEVQADISNQLSQGISKAQIARNLGLNVQTIYKYTK